MSIPFIFMVTLVVIAVVVVLILGILIELGSFLLTGIGGLFSLLLLMGAAYFCFHVGRGEVIRQDAQAQRIEENEVIRNIPPPPNVLKNREGHLIDLPLTPTEADISAEASAQEDLTRQPPSPPKPEPLVPALSPGLGEETPIGIRIVTRNSSGVVVAGGNVSQIPDWVQEASHPKSEQKNSPFSVLRSQRFSTLEEARQDNLRQLLMYLRRELPGELPVFLHKGLKVQDVEQSGIIRQECEILWPIQIGPYEEKVHELYWQIEINGRTKDQLLMACRPVVVKARLIRLTGVVLLASLIFGGAAIYFRHLRAA